MIHGDLAEIIDCRRGVAVVAAFIGLAVRLEMVVLVMVMQFAGQIVGRIELFLFVQAAQIAALRQIRRVMAVHLTAVLQRRGLPVLVGERADIVLKVVQMKRNHE